MQRRRLKGEIHALVSTELESRGFLAAFSERTGGVSGGVFESLNVGSETGDAPDLTLENRRLLADSLGVPDPTSFRQVHGTDIRSVSRSPGERGALEPADGLTTRAPGVPLAVMTADCVPLALASEEESFLSAVHVGWRGLAGGILAKALSMFDNPRGVAAAVGPSVGPCHYEVGEEVVDAVTRGTGGSAVVLATGSRPRLDLGRTVEAVVRGLGVPRVERAEECTACEPARFFSHRRDGLTGRQALIAMRL